MLRETTTTIHIDSIPITTTVSEPDPLTRIQLANRTPDGDPENWTLEEIARFMIEISAACTNLSRTLISQLPASIQMELGGEVCYHLENWDRIDRQEDREFMEEHDGAPSVEDIHNHVVGGHDEADQ